MRSSVSDSTARPGLLAILLVVAACLPLVAITPQDGHSYATNLSWLTGFAQALFDGDPYPRWIPSLTAGAGSPVFVFYAPLPFYVTTMAATVCGGCTAPGQLGLAESALLVASAAAFLVYARPKVGATAAAIGAVCYALAPYHVAIDLFERQAIGELAAYALFPLALLAVDRLSPGGRGIAALSLVYALLVMSHLPTTLLFSPFLALYALIVGRRSGNTPALLTRFALAIVLGLCLSAIYLMPALGDLRHISADEFYTSWYDYRQWFFFDGRPSPDERFALRLLAAMLTVTACTAACLLLWRRAAGSRLAAPGDAAALSGARLLITGAALFAVGAWFLSTPLSLPLWSTVPVLPKVQFPWRSSVLLDLAAGMSVAAAWQAVSGRRRLLVALAFVVPVGLSMALSGWTLFKFNQLAKDPLHQAKVTAYLQEGADTPEYIPAVVGKSRAEVLKVLLPQRVPVVPTPQATVRVTRWEPRRIELLASSAVPFTAIVRQFAYPGWRAVAIDGPGGQQTDLPIRPDPVTGLIDLQIPGGEQAVRLTLERSGNERIGTLISALAAATILIVIAAAGIRRASSRKPAG